jgi:hypothetical protein
VNSLTAGYRTEADMGELENDIADVVMHCTINVICGPKSLRPWNNATIRWSIITISTDDMERTYKPCGASGPSASTQKEPPLSRVRFEDRACLPMASL